MQNSLRKMLARMFADKKRQRRIVAVVCVLSVLVTTAVFTELMQPVITMTPDPVCGQAEHAHGPDCFENQLICDSEEGEEHAHADGCYKSILTCGKSEHSHTEKCYPEKVEEQKVAVIESTEAPATEAPAAEPTEAPAVMTLSEDEPTEAPATEAPVTEEPTAMSETEPAVEATAEPVVEPTAEPVVEATAEPTVEATEEPVAEPTVVPAPAVAVTAVSAEKVFVGQTVTWTVEASGEAELTYYIADESGAEIVSGALDVDASYISWLADHAGTFTLTVTAANETGSASANGSVTVEASEALVAAALADQLYCFAGEEITFRFAYSGGVEPASVSIAVYQDGQVLTELTEFAETVAVTPANLGEKVTTVTAEITVTDSLGSTVTGVCEIPCAVRIRETESDWEKSTRVDLTGEWPEDLIAVAETQLGYEESEINFIVNDEGERQGYTRYGQWYGSSYSEWCAMFVSFDLNYAEIPEKYFPREAKCEKWISALKSRGLYESAEGDYEPQVGDLVFFDWEDNDESDHVGIITAVTDKKIETIEGNADKGVRRRDYDRDDEVLYGYGCVLEAYEKYLRDELDLDLEAGVGAKGIVTAETANLRAEADAESELVAQLAIDTVVDVLAAEQNRAEIWYKVSAGELTGWLRSDLVEINYVVEEDLTPAVADYDSLIARVAALPFDESEAHYLEAAAIASDAEMAVTAGTITGDQYAEIINLMTGSAVMTLAADDGIAVAAEEGIALAAEGVSAAKASKMSDNYYGWEISMVFVPVDASGNVLEDVAAPAPIRSKFLYTEWSSSKSVAANSADIKALLPNDTIYNIDFEYVADGTKAKDAEYLKINGGTSSGCTMKVGKTSATTTCTKTQIQSYYLAVYYIPTVCEIEFVDGETQVNAISCYPGATVDLSEVAAGYELNAANEDGKYFTGWQDADGNVYRFEIENVSSAMTLSAVWSDVPLGEHTITFIANGAQIGTAAALDSLKFGEVAAPDAAKEGYRFDGWFTAEDESGVQYTAATVISESVTLYAHYTEYIDVSFVINDSNYTNDPGSGYTHVTVNSIEGLNADGFTYTLVGTGDRYRVSGTGTLVTFTIPAGESLSMNGLSTVAINVENQVESGGTSNNTYTYVSTYSWLDGAKVCNANTIFNADTTLVLRLYQNDETYSLNFVCCEACGNSITFALSEAGVATTNPSFAVGESVDAAYFPADSDVNAYFSCNTCSACGRKTGEGETSMVLDYWYIIDENTPFTPGTAIGDTHVALATGNSIPVYAAWKEAPNNVTVKFQNPDYSEISSSSEVTCYSAFGTIKPENPVLDGCTFVGWTMDGGATLVSDDYIVSADATFMAVYDATISVQMPDLENGDLTTYTTVNTLTVRTGEFLSNDDFVAATFSNGYIFSGWLPEGDSWPTTDLSGYTVTKAITVKAQYEQAYTLTFRYHTEEMAEGEYAVAATYYVKANGTIYDAMDENGNSVNGAFPTLTVPGYTFNNWMDSNGNYASPSYSSYTADTVYTASLTALPAHTVTFQYIIEGDGISETATAATYKTTSSEATLRDIIAAAEGVEAENAQLPVCPQTLPTKYFAHWATADDAVATLDTVITGDTTFTAVFADKVHVKFQYSYEDAETGANITGIAGECYVIPGQPLSTAMTELPVVELPGMRFGGWIEMFDDGTQTKVELDTVVTVDEGETEVVYSARLDTEISINFVYQDIMDSDVDGDTEEVITHAVYTMLPDNALSTAILMNADGTATEQTLSAIPVPPTFENYRFTGWYYNEGDAAVQLTEADLELPTLLETNFTGIYEYHPGYTVTFHDVDPDGNDKLPDGVESIDVLVPNGEALADYLPEVSLKDRTADEVIRWYTLDADGARTEFDPTQPLTADLHLYTYTYRIVLTLGEETTEEETASLLDLLIPSAYAAEVNVSDDGDTLTIEIADGEVLKASDLIVTNDDGSITDYTMYTWQKEDGTVFYLSDYIGQEITESISATADSDSEVEAVISTGGVYFYVCIDGTWTVVGSTSRVYAGFPEETSRYYVTLNQIRAVYEAYGYDFFLSDSSIDYCFPHSSGTGTNVWNDVQAAKNDNNVWCIPIGGSATTRYNIYYLPTLDAIGNDYRNGEIYAETTARKTPNTFWSVTVQDDNKLVYGADETLPATQYVLNGTDKTLTLLTPPEDYKWAIDESETDSASYDQFTQTSNGNGKTSITITNVDGPIVINIAEPQTFTITVSDDEHHIYDESESLPDVVSVREGNDAAITLKTPAVDEDGNPEYFWCVSGTYGRITSVVDGENTVYTIVNVQSDLSIEPAEIGSYIINYDINLDDVDQDDIETKLPTIDSVSDVFEVTTEGLYIVKTPSPITYSYNNNDNSWRTVSFEGWFVDEDSDGVKDEGEEVLVAGQMLSPAKLAELAGDTKTVSLVGNWVDQEKAGSVSFYINLEMEVANYDGSTTETPDENFTGTVYATKLTIDPEPTTYTNQNVIEAASESDTANVDQKLRKLASGVEAAYIGTDRVFTLDSFPDDETVLEAVRAYQTTYINSFQSSSYYDSDDPDNVESYRAANQRIICIDDADGVLRYIPVSELTSANYTVRWYVFKYDDSNCWHVDGVLVRKQGQLVVTKNFYGNELAIADVKDNPYTISVYDKDGNEVYTLNLNQKSDSNANGYTAYDSATDTYTWVLTLNQNAVYTLKENAYEAATNYVINDLTVEMASLSEYMVINAKEDAENKGRTTYQEEDGVSVTIRAYEADLNYTSFKTVKFFNSYIPTNTMLLSKVDTSDAAMKGIIFQLLKMNEDGEYVVNPVWKDEAGVYYSFYPTSSIDATKYSNGYITTDTLGYAMIVGLKDEKCEGDYQLVEVNTPVGYGQIAPIFFNLSSSGIITLDDHPAAEIDEDDNIKLTVTNTSQNMDVTVNKVWTDDADIEVTVALCLDNTPMAAYTVVLNETNNWSHTFEDVPTYVGGELADYSLRETWIGESAYSGTINDGYENYEVTYSDPAYTYDENGMPEALSLTVSNRVSTGGVEFTKLDEKGNALSGANFAVYTLYQDEACENQYGESVQSDENGKVDFGNLAVGTYYLQETAAPAGYKTDTTVYKVVVAASGTTITKVTEVNGTGINVIRNYPIVSPVVNKVDANGSALTGATFELRKLSNDVYGKVEGYFTTDGTKASWTLADLEAGDYRIVETDAPDGYYMMSETIDFTVADGVIEITNYKSHEEDSSIYSGNSWTYDASTSTFTVTNTPGVELPSTGGAGTLPYMIGGLLLMAASLLYGIGQRRKGERGDTD